MWEEGLDIREPSSVGRGAFGPIAARGRSLSPGERRAFIRGPHEGVFSSGSSTAGPARDLSPTLSRGYRLAPHSIS